MQAILVREETQNYLHMIGFWYRHLHNEWLNWLDVHALPFLFVSLDIFWHYIIQLV